MSDTPRDFWQADVTCERRADGVCYIRQRGRLGAYPDKLPDRLRAWADRTPSQVWLAQRRGGDWRRIAYGAGHEMVRRLAQGLLDLNLSVERPLLILSENDIEHALLATAAQYVGVPSAAVSTAYSLVSRDFGKLGCIVSQLTPGAVFAADPARYHDAIAAALPAETPVIGTRADTARGIAIAFADLASTPARDVDAAGAAVTPDTIAKFLFTSGTTGQPKAVIQTQRMLCANQEMVADCYAFARREPPVVVDWAPWSHTASGNKVFNFVLYNGGTYHIDDGKPAPALFGETVRNLKSVSPTWYFNVPAGYELLVDAMETDGQLRHSFFRRLKLMMYAGAGMAQHTWDRLRQMAAETAAHPVLLATGLGSTETAPFALFCTASQPAPGNIGIPAKGLTLKLVPRDGKLEARLKGPTVTPGYWRDPALSARAFDEEGYYRLGDALRFADPDDAAKGFFFDGRIAENFKLRTGTWVAVGPLRARLVDQMGGLICDAVLSGPDRPTVAALLIPSLPALRALVPDGDSLTDREVLSRREVVAAVRDRLNAHARAATGSASRVTRVMLFDGTLSIDRNEITDKGSINQRAVLDQRSREIAALHGDDPRVIVADLPTAQPPH